MLFKKKNLSSSSSRSSGSSKYTYTSDGDEEDDNKPSYSEIVADYDALVANGTPRAKIAGAITEDYNSGYITKAQYDKLMSIYVRSSATSGGHYTY